MGIQKVIFEMIRPNLKDRITIEDIKTKLYQMQFPYNPQIRQLNDIPIKLIPSSYKAYIMNISEIHRSTINAASIVCNPFSDIEQTS